MTKEGVEKVIKRYPKLAKAMRQKQNPAKFYIGRRRHIVVISEEVKVIFKIIEDIYAHEENYWIRKMIDGMKKGRRDVAIMHDIPWAKNAYYERKRKIIEKVYNCCISRNLVDYNEILKEEIV